MDGFYIKWRNFWFSLFGRSVFFLINKLIGFGVVFVVMEEQFILRVPPSIAERLDRLLSENENASSSEDKSLDLSFSGENVLSLTKLAFYNNLRDVLESKIWLIWIQNFFFFFKWGSKNLHRFDDNWQYLKQKDDALGLLCIHWSFMCLMGCFVH